MRSHCSFPNMSKGGGKQTLLCRFMYRVKTNIRRTAIFAAIGWHSACFQVPVRCVQLQHLRPCAPAGSIRCPIENEENRPHRRWSAITLCTTPVLPVLESRMDRLRLHSCCCFGRGSYQHCTRQDSKIT